MSRGTQDFDRLGSGGTLLEKVRGADHRRHSSLIPGRLGLDPGVEYPAGAGDAFRGVIRGTACRVSERDGELAAGAGDRSGMIE